MKSETQALSISEKVGYSLGDAGTNFVFQTQMVFLMYFYTDVVGIPAAAVGTLLLITRMWDAVNDPLMGALADRTNTRWGKFRPWVLWTAVPFGVLFVLTFTSPQMGAGGKLAWAYVTYIGLKTIYAANNIPYSALMGVMTADSAERTSLVSYRFIFVLLAVLVIQAFVNDLVDVLGRDNASIVHATVSEDKLRVEEAGLGTAQIAVTAIDPSGHEITRKLVVKVVAKESALLDRTPHRQQQRKDTISMPPPKKAKPLEAVTLSAGFGSRVFNLADVFAEPDVVAQRYSVEVVDLAKGFQRTVIFFAVLAVLFFFITFATTRERVQADPRQKGTIRQDLSDLMHNGPWVALFVLTIFIFVNLAMRGAITLYYFRYYLGREELFGLFNAVGLSVAVVGILLSRPLSQRYGKRNTFRVCLLLTAVFIFLFVFVPPGAIWAIFVLQILLQLSYGPTIPLLWAMMADVADYSEWKTGRRATGMTFSAASFGSKAGLGLGGAASGWLLARYGYVPNVDQSEATLNGILWMMSVYPAVAFLIGVAILCFYGIDKQVNQQIQEDLAERRKHYGSTAEEAI